MTGTLDPPPGQPSARQGLVLGIDPGSHETGWGIVRREGSRLRYVAHGVIRPAGPDLAARLDDLTSRIGGVVSDHSPSEAAMEDVFVSRNPRAALKLGQARGAILACLAGRGLRVGSYPPATVKRAVTGYGRAGKEQVALMVRSILGLDRVPPSDAADALAVAVCHARTLR